ncbi:MAG: nitroreductase family protein [candidate division Zixibacteria bacterium]
MISNPVIDAMMNRKSLRKYTDEMPSDEVIETIVRAGQQAPFAAQACSLLLKRGDKHIPFKAPLLFTICVDRHKLALIMKKRNWDMKSCDLLMLLFGLQDAVLMAENIVIAAESLGMGSCFLGHPPFSAKTIKQKYNLPEGVYPIVQLTVGYAAEEKPTRPRYPLDYFLFEDKYPEFSDETIENAMKVMDEGFLSQDYYNYLNAKILLEGGREETYTLENYSWTEHMGRKWGQWWPSPKNLLENLKACGFDVGG